MLMAFEIWHELEVRDGRGIFVEWAWENWQDAWNAARDSLTDEKRNAAHDMHCMTWLTESTPERQKYAYADGHHRGWVDAKSCLMDNGEKESLK